VLLVEAEDAIGGGLRSAELTLPGFTHDICSAIHPFAYASPFFRTLPLEQFGLSWIHPPAAAAHPLPDGSAVIVESSLDDTSSSLGDDGKAYASLLGPACQVLNDVVQATSLAGTVPHLLAAPRPAWNALRSATGLALARFRQEPARALLAGMAAHSMLPLEKLSTAAIALALLAAAHTGGWPFPRGGAQQLANALADYLRSLGGSIETGRRVHDLRELPPARAVLLDLTPRQVLELAGQRFPDEFRRRLGKYRYGIAAFKMDWALSQPVPWRSRELRRAATIHLGGTMEEIAEAERAPWQGAVSDRPFLITAQHTLFDDSRAPAGRHTLWGYSHVPPGSDVDMTERMEAQIERFAPGFRDTIIGRSAMPPRALEAHNANLVAGDILGGAQDLAQTLIRPTLRYWTTPLHNVYLCSASTPPGAGVHGMCGHLAGRIALRRSFGLRSV
jgi:phytoene dehydrogenase-like protein